DLDDVLVRHQRKERSEIDALGERVDDDRFVAAGHLCHAEPGIISALAQKLGVYGDEGMARHARTRVGKVCGGRNRLHGRKIAYTSRFVRGGDEGLRRDITCAAM